MEQYWNSLRKYRIDTETFSDCENIRIMGGLFAAIVKLKILKKSTFSVAHSDAYIEFLDRRNLEKKDESI